MSQPSPSLTRSAQVNTFAEDWKKGPIGYGLFAENSERKDGNFLKKCAAGRPAARGRRTP